MHFPIDLHIGTFTLSSHFIFNILALAIAIRYYLYLRKKEKVISELNHLPIILGGLLGGLFGARLIDMAYVAPTSLLERVGLISYFFFGGKTIVGALAGGIVGIELMKWIRKEKKKTVGDMFTYPIILGIMIGRVGCFLTGVRDDTVGVASSLPWAFDQGDGIPRHPTALYEIVFLGLFWVILRLIDRRFRLAEGVRFRIFIVTYMTFRFLVDFLKPSVPMLFGLTAIQFVCIALALWYSIDIILKQKRYGRTATT